MAFNRIKLWGIASALVIGLIACEQQKTEPVQEEKEVQKEEIQEFPNEGKIAYVNIDSLEKHYVYLNEKRKELNNRQNAIENELKRMNTQYESKMKELQEKYQKGTLTQEEAEKGEKDLMSLQQRFEQRQYETQNELLSLQENLMRDLQEKLNNFIEKYNADKKYAYILSYGEGGSILYADPKYEITNDVIEGMNAEEKKDKE